MTGNVCLPLSVGHTEPSPSGFSHLKINDGLMQKTDVPVIESSPYSIKCIHNANSQTNKRKAESSPTTLESQLLPFSPDFPNTKRRLVLDSPYPLQNVTPSSIEINTPDTLRKGNEMLLEKTL